MWPGIALRPDFNAAQLRSLAKATRNAGQSRRLLALAEIYDGGSRTKAARIGGVGLQTLRDWVVKFNARGPEGLINGKAPGNACKLNDSQRQADLPPGGQGRSLGHAQVRHTSDEPASGGSRASRGAPGAHGVMLMDRAGWHRAKDLVVPDNLTLVLLPARAPELNPVENIWQFLRENWLSSRVFASYSDIVLRFTLSYRDVEELLAERGIQTSYETVRRWVLKFGPLFARNLRRLRPKPASTWHLDEMVVSIQGKRMYLWRAVDSEGEVLDLLVQSKRDTAAALRLMRKLLKKQGYAPDQLVTDKLGSYGAARRELRLSCRHEQGLRKNNRAENSHQPVRRRERK